jgi:hypothetical protein
MEQLLADGVEVLWQKVDVLARHQSSASKYARLD